MAAAKWAVCVVCDSLRFGGATAATSGPLAAKTSTAMTEKRKRPPTARVIDMTDDDADDDDDVDDGVVKLSCVGVST